jgi:hypothetical protein
MTVNNTTTTTTTTDDKKTRIQRTPEQSFGFELNNPLELVNETKTVRIPAKEWGTSPLLASPRAEDDSVYLRQIVDRVNNIRVDADTLYTLKDAMDAITQDADTVSIKLPDGVKSIKDATPRDLLDSVLIGLSTSDGVFLVSMGDLIDATFETLQSSMLVRPSDVKESFRVAIAQRQKKIVKDVTSIVSALKRRAR